VSRCKPEENHEHKIRHTPGVLSAVLLLLTAYPLLAQITPAQRLTNSYALELEGKPAPAIVELQALLNSSSLDAPGSGKAWNILGVAYEDMGEFALSQHAHEESPRILDLFANEPTSMIADDGMAGCLMMFGGPGFSVRKSVTG
jgi:cytochrome c-type biogenesis protein CcmH/NrfG